VVAGAGIREIESGKRNDRPQLTAALAACKRHKAKLVIAKLDRLSRNLAFIAALMESGVEFVAVDNPTQTSSQCTFWRSSPSMSGN
jgi:DNA invertase Pin-like site-specific DNA recombinase